MLITCTTCNTDIDTTNLVLSERPQGNLIKVFYACPHCGTEYHVMYHNDETKELQRKMEVARARRDMVAFAKIQAIFKKKIDKLNNR